MPRRGVYRDRISRILPSRDRVSRLLPSSGRVERVMRSRDRVSRVLTSNNWADIREQPEPGSSSGSRRGKIYRYQGFTREGVIINQIGSDRHCLSKSTSSVSFIVILCVFSEVSYFEYCLIFRLNVWNEVPTVCLQYLQLFHLCAVQDRLKVWLS